MPPLFDRPRHAKPREVPAAKAVLVPVLLVGCTSTAMGGLAVSASAEPPITAVSAAASTTVTLADLSRMREERTQERASRDRALAVIRAEAERVAAEQAAVAEAARVAAAAEAARVAAEQAEQARVAAEQAAAEQAAREAAEAAEEQAEAGDRPTKATSGGYARPGVGRLTSGYGSRWGRMHNGIDLAAGTGSPIRAVAAGTVVSAKTENGYGRAVRIKHGDGTETLYAHNSSLLVSAGQKVGAGEQIAREGSTGNSTGPHLHFEVRVGGRNVNPLSWLRDRGVNV